MAKILRKSQGLISKINILLLAKNRYFVIIVFKVLNVELRFEYTKLITKGKSVLASLFSKSQEKLRKSQA